MRTHDTPFLRKKKCHRSWRLNYFLNEYMPIMPCRNRIFYTFLLQWTQKKDSLRLIQNVYKNTIVALCKCTRNYWFSLGFSSLIESQWFNIWFHCRVLCASLYWLLLRDRDSQLYHKRHIVSVRCSEIFVEMYHNKWTRSASLLFFRPSYGLDNHMPCDEENSYRTMYCWNPDLWKPSVYCAI